MHREITSGQNHHLPSFQLPSHAVLAQARAIELIVGDTLLNGVMTLAGRIRQILMDAIADGVDLLAVFRRFDVNHDGHIEQRELICALESMGLTPKQWGKSFLADIAAFVDSIDSFEGTDSNAVIEYDSKVDYQEFIKFVLEDLSCCRRRGLEGLQPAPRVLEGKRVIGLFFGTSWAPQTVKLAKLLELFYNNLKQQGDDSFEVIYVSHDQNCDRFVEFYQTHPWTAIPYEDRERRHYMEQKLHVTTLPRLVLLDNAGGVLSHDAKFEIMDHADTPKIAMRNWLSQNYISSMADRQDSRTSRHMGGSNRLTFVSGRGELL